MAGYSGGRWLVAVATLKAKHHKQRCGLRLLS
jgi:hypothetical protein